MLIAVDGQPGAEIELVVRISPPSEEQVPELAISIELVTRGKAVVQNAFSFQHQYCWIHNAQKKIDQKKRVMKLRSAFATSSYIRHRTTIPCVLYGLDFWS